MDVKRRPYWMIAAAIIVALFVAVVMILRDESNPHTPDVAVATRFTRPVLIGYEQGVRRWSLEAEYVEEVPESEGTIVRLTDVTEGILYREGEPRLRFTADYGTWDPATEHLVLTGNVRFLQDDQQISADTLFADMKAGQMHFQGHVVWRTENGAEIRSDEAMYWDRDQRVEFSSTAGPVAVTFENSK